MKTFSIVYLAVLVAAVAGSPHPHPEAVADAAADAAAVAEPVSVPDSDILEAGLAKRASCMHSSSCGKHSSYWCKDYCSEYGGYSYRMGCGNSYYVCCCKK